MFGINTNKSKWQEIANSCTDYKFKSAINDLFIPYKIKLSTYLINKDCFEQRYSYSYKFKHGSTFSMVHWAETVNLYDLPLGFPHWFYHAFPDVAKWASEDRSAKTVLKPLFDKYDSMQNFDIHDSDGRLTIYVLKRIVDLYVNTTHKKLEVSS